MNIVAQIIGILAMLINLLSFQQKKQKTIITFQFFGSVFFAVHFFLLGSAIGGILNVTAAIRAAIYSNKEKTGADKPFWIYIFTLAYIAAYILVFTVFRKEPTAANLIIEVLPVLSMVVTTVSFWMKDAKMLRALGLIGSPLWLIYNIINISIGGISSEVLNIASILLAMFRYDIHKGGNK